ncbi:hypothetical protein B5M44_19080 [Shinella sumterensis]|uniref:hypothetical protein n=1 Tax=Shinella sumterensis TaxID=1967501 RepID=UPI00106DFB9E|nr:hypothetical protein [Shinella sumterensis]MCD1266694.1 hypothetical protein [Shinella sumterensis]TFE96687.1 hypothetical protein B5M44_19080 [Shinella sumterensis]
MKDQLRNSRPDREVGLPVGSKLTLWIASVGTVLWLAGCFVLLRIKCDNGLACMAPNEWGDFTAGAFSTLAFIWLAVAVILQSTELREQRKELALTREEFELQREVMKEQANEAKRQANLLSAQTDILREENTDRRKMALVDQFDGTIEEIRSMLMYAGRIQFQVRSRKSGNVSYPHIGAGSSDRENAIADFVKEFEHYLPSIDLEKVEITAPPRDARTLRIVSRLIDKAIELARDPRTEDLRTWAVVRLKLDELSLILASLDLGAEYP